MVTQMAVSEPKNAAKNRFNISVERMNFCQ